MSCFSYTCCAWEKYMYADASDNKSTIACRTCLYCSGTEGIQHLKFVSTCLASQQLHSPNRKSMMTTATATEMLIPASQKRQKNANYRQVKLHFHYITFSTVVTKRLVNKHVKSCSHLFQHFHSHLYWSSMR